MESAFRMFIEECDNIQVCCSFDSRLKLLNATKDHQGLHVTNDTADFGSFINSFLSKFRDEFAKLPCLSFYILSENAPNEVDADDVRCHLLH